MIHLQLLPILAEVQRTSPQSLGPEQMFTQILIPAMLVFLGLPLLLLVVLWLISVRPRTNYIKLGTLDAEKLVCPYCNAKLEKVVSQRRMAPPFGQLTMVSCPGCHKVLGANVK